MHHQRLSSFQVGGHFLKTALQLSLEIVESFSVEEEWIEAY